MTARRLQNPMGRKYYIEIASILKEARNEDDGVEFITRELAIYFQGDNSRFDAQRFLDAAGSARYNPGDKLVKWIRENRAELNRAILNASPDADLTEDDIETWVMNDEGLYEWARSDGAIDDDDNDVEYDDDD